MDQGIPMGDLQQIVTCSCGRKNTLRFIKDKFKPLGDKEWRFKKSTGEWTCGRLSHTMKSVRHVPISKLIPMILD